jgi:hypothetical protein
VELYRKRDSRFYWYDFKWHDKRYRSSTKETNKIESREDCCFEALPQAMGGIAVADRACPKRAQRAKGNVRVPCVPCGIACEQAK